MNFASNSHSNDESHEARSQITYGADENNFLNSSYGSEEAYRGSILYGHFVANVNYGVADNCDEVIYGGSGSTRGHGHRRREYACVEDVVQDGGVDEEDERDGAHGTEVLDAVRSPTKRRKTMRNSLGSF